MEQYKNYCQCHEEILQSLEKAENSLTEFISQKVSCLSDCSDQQNKLNVCIFMDDDGYTIEEKLQYFLVFLCLNRLKSVFLRLLCPGSVTLSTLYCFYVVLEVFE